MSDLNWSMLLGKFYSIGRLYYDKSSNTFKDVSDLNVPHIPAYFCANSLLGKNCVCSPMPNQLPIELEMAMTKLESSYRNLLLEKFNLALATLQKLRPNIDVKESVQARVIVSRKNTIAKYTSDQEMFVYVISDEVDDQFYFEKSVRIRDTNDNKLYVYFLFEGEKLE